MTEWIKSAGMASSAAIRSTASLNEARLNEAAGKEATGGAGAAAGAEGARDGTMAAATASDAAGLDVTITLLTSLPVCGSARTTRVICRGRSGRPAADKRVAAKVAPNPSLKHKCVKMFCSSV